MMIPNPKTNMTPVPIPRMLSSMQQAYLDAMDIGVWSLRDPIVPEAALTKSLTQLKLGPGRGGVLLVCATDSDSSGRLANDINRVLHSAQVWSWPYVDDSAVDINLAVEENLFTTVAIFGKELASQFFDGELPDHLNSAKLLLLPSMQDIQNSAVARRTLWTTLCRSGMLDSG